jgi:hypothetical protein
MKTVPLTVIAAIAMVGTSNMMAQGSVIFNNRRGTITHVWASSSSLHITGNSPIDNPAGTTDYSGNTLIGAAGGLLAANTTLASLLGVQGVAADDSAMQPGLLGPGGITTTTFRTGSAAGNIVPATATFNNIAPGAPQATFEMVVWDNSSGLYPTWALAKDAWNAGLILAGKSPLFSFSTYIGGPLGGEPDWSQAVGVTSFNLTKAAPVPPTLTITRPTNDQISVAWPNTTTGFVLKQADSLTPPVIWSPVTTSPVNANGQFVVTVPADAAARFYLLKLE